eukprot:2241367-Rhodomonas_salina.2
MVEDAGCGDRAGGEDAKGEWESRLAGQGGTLFAKSKTKVEIKRERRNQTRTRLLDLEIKYEGGA